MDHSEQWRAIAGRIRGLAAAAQLNVAFLQFSSSDTYRRSHYQSVQCFEIFAEIENYVAHFRSSLPPLATKAIDDFLSERKTLFTAAARKPDIDDQQNHAVLVLLVTLETQLTFLLGDAQSAIRAKSERAFAHLQRSIVADPDIRKKWQAAFGRGETACEALGSVHLLMHGLYAFKISSIGGRTDLVFQEPVEKETEGLSAGLVLTEWKKSTSKRNLPSAFTAARKQAELYAPGILSGNELKGYRYAVVVTGDASNTPPDIVNDGVVYRHILICVNPIAPSRQARSR